MNELQSRLTDMLSWFHSLCVENGLRYYALGGTALGAVRHNGFIPWDDDIDVGMPRADYDRLRELTKQIYADTPYVLEFPSERKDFVYTYAKLYDTRTTLVENTRYNTKRGIYLDIFPLDGMADEYGEALARFKVIDKNFALLHTQTCAVRSGRKWYKNLSIVLSRCVPSFILDARKISEKINKLASERDFDSCKYVANCFGAWHEKEIHERRIYGTPTLCRFEGAEIYVQEDVDAYLKGLYGDYMKLPPVEKRVTHHDFIYLNLNEAYLTKKEN